VIECVGGVRVFVERSGEVDGDVGHEEQEAESGKQEALSSPEICLRQEDE
jgi:hypothetical protein